MGGPLALAGSLQESVASMARGPHSRVGGRPSSTRAWLQLAGDPRAQSLNIARQGWCLCWDAPGGQSPWAVRESAEDRGPPAVHPRPVPRLDPHASQLNPRKAVLFQAGIWAAAELSVVCCLGLPICGGGGGACVNDT